MDTHPLTGRLLGCSPATFFWVLLALYLPLWVLGLWTDKVVLLPGITLINLIVFTPAMAALILVYREHKVAGMTALLKRFFDYRRTGSTAWYVPMVLLFPCLALLQYAVSSFSGLQVSPPQLSLGLIFMFAVFFIGAVGEELGWMGYAINPVQERYGALWAGLLLGCAWAAFHIPLFALNSHLSADWIVWQCLYIVVARVLFVWVYNNTARSLFAMGIMHTSFNLAWQLFPSSGGLVVPSFYDPRFLALVSILLVVMVRWLWGRTLAEFRYAQLGQPFAR